MDYLDDNFPRVATFVPVGWCVQKNILFDLEGFSTEGFSPDERVFYDNEVRGASMIFAASSSDRVGNAHYEAFCYLGSGPDGGFDYQFKVKRSKKRTVYEDSGDDIADVHEAAERASTFMVTWAWHPERLVGPA